MNMSTDSILDQVALETIQGLASCPASPDRNDRQDFGEVFSTPLHVKPTQRGLKMFPSTDFQPCSNTVIIGRSRDIKEYPGNKRLRCLAMMYLDEYSKAEKDKYMKTKLVSRIIAMVNESCPNDTGFVKLDKAGTWHAASTAAAREKVGYTFRDLLADRYRSSSKSKVARLRAIRNGGEPDTFISDHDPLDWRQGESFSSLRLLIDTVPFLFKSISEAPPQTNSCAHEQLADDYEQLLRLPALLPCDE